MPDVLTAQAIATYLVISRRRVYELLDLKVEYGGIANFKVGTSRRVFKAKFEEWLKRQEVQG